jgi:hypothetical protein
MIVARIFEKEPVIRATAFHAYRRHPNGKVITSP